MAWFIGIAQHPHKIDEQPDRTLFHTRDEKRRVCDALASGDLNDIPVVIDHAGGEQGMTGEGSGLFVVPAHKKIGRMTEAFMDAAGNLHTVVELRYDRPETRDIVNSLGRKERWGLSLCTDYERLPGDTGRVQNKRISHIGITRNPEYGDDGHTWLYDGSMSPAGLDRIIHDNYLSVPGMYIPEATRKRVVATTGTESGHHTTTPPPDSADRSSISRGSAHITPISPVTLHSVGATRMSDLAVPSFPATTTPAAVASAPTTPPDSNVDRATTTTADASQRDIIAELTALNNAADNFMKGSSFDTQEDYYNDELFAAAVVVKDGFTSLIQKAMQAGVPNDAFPRHTFSRLGKLDSYIDNTKEALRKVVNASAVGGSGRADVLKLIDNPMAQRPFLSQVMATGNQTLVSMRLTEARMETEQKMEALKDENAQLREEISGLKKRSHSEMSNGAVDALRAAPAPVPMSVGASRPSPEPVSAVSMNAISNFWSKLAPARQEAFGGNGDTQEQKSLNAVMAHLSSYRKNKSISAGNENVFTTSE